MRRRDRRQRDNVRLLLWTTMMTTAGIVLATTRQTLADENKDSLRFRTTTKGEDDEEIDTFPTYYHTTEQVYDYFESIAKDDKECPRRGDFFTIHLDNVEKEGKSLLTVTFRRKSAKDAAEEENAAKKGAREDEEAGTKEAEKGRLRFQEREERLRRRRRAEETPLSEPAPERVMFLFGEHAREFVSVESAIALSKALCHAADSDDENAGEGGEAEVSLLARRALERYDEILLVPVANPLGRARAEGGDFCYRANEDGIDLNRNWGDHWESSVSGDLNSGSGPFSEPETKILKEIVDVLAAKEGGLRVFVTVHSGTLGMYTPFAYSRDVPQRPEEKEMLKMLYPLDEEHCQCPMGAAGKEVGYLCPGTCLDYAYDVAKVPYAFAFEIYADAKETATCRATFAQQKHRFAADASFSSASMSEGTSSSSSSSSSTSRAGAPDSNEVPFANALEPFALVEIEAEVGAAHRHSDFLAHRQAASERTMQRLAPESCFGFFNPTTEEDLRRVTDNWTRVYLKLITRIPSLTEKNTEGLVSPGESLVLTASTKKQVSDTMDVALAMGVSASSTSIVASPA